MDQFRRRGTAAAGDGDESFWLPLLREKSGGCMGLGATWSDWEEEKAPCPFCSVALLHKAGLNENHLHQ